MQNIRLDQIRNSAKNELKRIHTLCPNRWTICGDALATFNQSIKQSEFIQINKYIQPVTVDN